MANNLHNKEPHGSVRCERVHPTFPHDGWTNLHDGKWCTFVHPWTDHKSYEMNTPQTIKDLSEMVKPTQLGMKIIEEQEQNLESGSIQCSFSLPTTVQILRLLGVNKCSLIRFSSTIDLILSCFVDIRN